MAAEPEQINTIEIAEESMPGRVYQVLAAIPYGKVVSYGVVASMAGSPRGARQVGTILRRLPKDSTLPWYRVVNSQGKISLSGLRERDQHSRLRQEGVLFSKTGKINLKIYGWYG